MDRPALADFLRRRRETLQPADVGLAKGPRRRTRGLRREEVAGLAGMSTDYYARLEQQRGPQPSEQIVVALARALRLTLDERDYLLRIIGHAPRRRLRREHVSPPLLRVLDRLHDAPALVLTELGETLAQNPLAIALLGDHGGHTGFARSAFYRWFTDPDERRPYTAADHPHQSRVQAAGLRVALSLRGSDPWVAALVQDLLRCSREFRTVWEQHEVSVRFDDHKTLIHPEVGEIELDCQALFTEDQTQVLLVLTATPGTAADRLQLLGVIGQQQLTT